MDKSILLLFYKLFYCGKRCGYPGENYFFKFCISFLTILVYYNGKLFVFRGDGKMNLDILFGNVLEIIKDELSSLSFSTWFEELKLVSLKENMATLQVPMEIHKTQLTHYYYETIKKAFQQVTGEDVELEFLLEKEIKEKQEQSLKIEEEQKIKEDVDNNVFQIKSNLKSIYTFDNFVVGNSNKFAQAAALSVAENPGKMYNPLFLYGNSGLGKTHLMHAIGNYIVEHSNKKVLYVRSDQFISDFINTNKKDDEGTNYNYVEFFKNKYRNIDVLIIDDIQFLGGANKTQQEFFHTFNTLHDDSKQIIISSDRSPEDLKLLEERLRTRFSWGLTVNIYPPDFTLRMEILRKKIIAGNFEQDIPEDVIEYVASNIGSDVRQLEGAITRLVAYSTIMGSAPITLELAIDALPNFVNKGLCEKNDIARIQKIVAEFFQINVEDIRSKKRSANIAFPRQVAMYLCRTMTSESFPKIGIEFGGKDHTTIMYSVEKIENEMKENKDLANIIEKLKKDIG